MHFLQAINSDISVLIVCNKTGGTIKGDIKKKKNFPSGDENLVQSVTTECFINRPSFSDTDCRRQILGECNKEKPTPTSARSKAWVCGHSLAATGGSIPARGMDVCLLRDACYQIEFSVSG